MCDRALVGRAPPAIDWERAESPGGRDYGPEEATRYARRFGVTPEWLLTGLRQAQTDMPFAPERFEPARQAGGTANFRCLTMNRPRLVTVSPGKLRAICTPEVADRNGP